MADTRTIRDRQAAADRSIDRASGGTKDASAAHLVQTTAVASYPTTASAYYACLLCDVAGEEVEGGAASYAVRTDAPPIFCLNLGTAVPPQGTRLVAHAVGGRCTIRYDG